MDTLDAMGSARSMRWLKPDPVPEELIEKLLWAATRASSPNNVQPWDFVVVSDQEVRKMIGAAVAHGADYVRSLPDPGTKSDRITLQGAHNIFANLAEVPVIIFICGKNVYPADAPAVSMMYSAMYSAAQNLLVAARAIGLGAAYTTVHLVNEPAVREILGIPEDRHIGVTMPVGFPQRSFSPVRRKPLAEVVHHDRW